MAPRANWKGYLKLSLVSCPVALFPATSTRERVHFHIINRETGNRIRNQRVDADTGEVVEDDAQVKGYKVEGDRYVLVEDEELDKVALESTHTIDIEKFVPRSEVEEIYFENTYYLAPDDKIGQEAFSVIRAAMEKEDMVGLARVVLYRRERLLMLAPHGKGIIATALHYRNEVRNAETYFDEIPNAKISQDMLDLAVHIVKSKEGKFDPSEFDDRYEDALVALIKSKQAGKAIPTPTRAKASNVIDLMDALRRSVKAERGSETRAESAPPRKAASRKAAPKRKLKRAG
jgi:DNA end-binding protein Ku